MLKQGVTTFTVTYVATYVVTYSLNCPEVSEFVARSFQSSGYCSWEEQNLATANIASYLFDSVKICNCMGLDLVEGMGDPEGIGRYIAGC